MLLQRCENKNLCNLFWKGHKKTRWIAAWVSACLCLRVRVLFMSLLMNTLPRLIGLLSRYISFWWKIALAFDRKHTKQSQIKWNQRILQASAARERENLVFSIYKFVCVYATLTSTLTDHKFCIQEKTNLGHTQFRCY